MDKRRALFFFLYLILIFYLSSIPNLKIKSVFNYQDLFFHFVEYFIFMFLALWAFPKAQYPSILLFAQLFAFSDELHQFFVPGRTFSFLDFLADFIGAFLCLIAIIKYKENLLGEGNKRSKNSGSQNMQSI